MNRLDLNPKPKDGTKHTVVTLDLKLTIEFPDDRSAAIAGIGDTLERVLANRPDIAERMVDAICAEHDCKAFAFEFGIKRASQRLTKPNAARLGEHR